MADTVKLKNKANNGLVEVSTELSETLLATGQWEKVAAPRKSTARKAE